MKEKYGVYANSNIEIAISKFFKVVHYKQEEKYGCKLYKDNKLIAIVERNFKEKVKAKYAFINSKNVKECNDFELSKLLDSDYQEIDMENMFLKDTIIINEDIVELPKVSEAGIEKCLKTWTLGIEFKQTQSQLIFYMQTTSLSYVFSVENDNIYCGISHNVPFEKGLFGGGQYFRIRDFKDNEAPFCWWACNLGGQIKQIDFDKEISSSGQCVVNEQGIYWLLKDYTDDEITLQGCGEDEYKYYRNKRMVEYFK